MADVTTVSAHGFEHRPDFIPSQAHKIIRFFISKEKMKHTSPSHKVVTDTITDLHQIGRASQQSPHAITHDEEIEKITRLMTPGVMLPKDSDAEGPPKGIVERLDTPKLPRHYIKLDDGQLMHITTYLSW